MEWLRVQSTIVYNYIRVVKSMAGITTYIPEEQEKYSKAMDINKIDRPVEAYEIKNFNDNYDSFNVKEFKAKFAKAG